MYDARNSIVARGVRVDFYDANGAKTSELSAREGEIDRMTRDMTARGNVVLQTAEGTRMSTDHLQFLNRSQKIVTDGFVEIVRGRDVLTGYGLETDPDLEAGQFVIQRDVHASVREAPGGAPGERREGDGSH